MNIVWCGNKMRVHSIGKENSWKLRFVTREVVVPSCQSVRDKILFFYFFVFTLRERQSFDIIFSDTYTGIDIVVEIVEVIRSEVDQQSST